jgi:hypothetical protein
MNKTVLNLEVWCLLTTQYKALLLIRSIIACDCGSLSFILRPHFLNAFLGVSRFVLGVICRKKILSKSFNKPQDTNFIQCYTTFILHILDSVYRHERASNKPILRRRYLLNWSSAYPFITVMRLLVP